MKSTIFIYRSCMIMLCFFTLCISCWTDNPIHQTSIRALLAVCNVTSSNQYGLSLEVTRHSISVTMVAVSWISLIVSECVWDWFKFQGEVTAAFQASKACLRACSNASKVLRSQCTNQTIAGSYSHPLPCKGPLLSSKRMLTPSKIMAAAPVTTEKGTTICQAQKTFRSRLLWSEDSQHR